MNIKHPAQNSLVTHLTWLLVPIERKPGFSSVWWTRSGFTHMKRYVERFTETLRLRREHSDGGGLSLSGLDTARTLGQES